jgi:hypothetical protein
MYCSNGGCVKCNLLFLFNMKLKCDECKGIGSYDCDSEPGPYGTTINVECPDCDGQGWIEVEDEDEPFVETLCSQIKDKFVTDAEAVFIDDRPAGSMIFAFAPRDQKTYHITYFIERGNIETEATPLLGGLTLNAAGITHAITSFINSTGVAESEIKYIVEL